MNETMKKPANSEDQSLDLLVKEFLAEIKLKVGKGTLDQDEAMGHKKKIESLLAEGKTAEVQEYIQRYQS